MKYVAFSGGLDSAYIVLKYLSENEIVQPIYVNDIENHINELAIQCVNIFKKKFDHLKKLIIIEPLEKEKSIEIQNKIKLHDKTQIFKDDPWHYKIFNTLIDYTEKNNIEIAIGIGKHDNLSHRLLINNIQIKNKRIIQPELYFMNKIVWELYDKTKKECVEDIKNIDFNLLEFLFENTVSCGYISKYLKEKKYCGKCHKCLEVKNAKIHHYINMNKITKNRNILKI